jgi:ribokinase
MTSLRADLASSRYRAMIGVGGIGAGSFFALNGDLTLGREESRSGRFLDRRDYCKLHIISHYVRALLGPEFVTMPIGMVGDDEVGERLVREMREVGLDMRYVQVAPGSQTLFSFCFIYPDGSGGNMTTDDSACSRVDAPLVMAAEPEFARFAGMGVALAAPEVPLAARKMLLDLGTRYHFLRAASFAAEEMARAAELGVLQQLDLVALNLNEAAAVAGMPAEGRRPVEIAEATVDVLCRHNSAMWATITAGGHGSWVWDGQRLTFRPAIRTTVASTAGAGDAFLAGMIVGIVAGLTVEHAHELAALVAAQSVTSPHTINKETNRETLSRLARGTQPQMNDAVWRLLDA